MLMRQITAVTVAVVLASFAGPLAFAQAPAGLIAGTARQEAKQPYANYSVRARAVDTGAIAASIPLDASANFVLQNLNNNRYLIELVLTKDNKVVCTEGPIGLTPANPMKKNVNIACGVPALVWLLPAAAAAGVAAAVTRGPASPSK